MLINLTRLCMLMAGPIFAYSLFVMQPQIEVLTSLDGTSRFLTSLTMEADAWRTSHVLLTVGTLFYIGAGIGAGTIVARKNRWVGSAIGTFLVVGFAGFIGNFALDFVYGALATLQDGDSAQAARTAILSDPIIQLLFVKGPAVIVLLGMLVLSLSALLAGWLPRIVGVLIIAGWATTIGLHSMLPYAEVIGHFVVGIGFWVISFTKSEG